MDSGCVESEADLEELYDVSQPLLPEEVLGIIDQLICLEVSDGPLKTWLILESHEMADGLAPRIPPLADPVHKRLRRLPLYARPEEHKRGAICAEPKVERGAATDARGLARLLFGYVESLRLRQRANSK